MGFPKVSNQAPVAAPYLVISGLTPLPGPALVGTNNLQTPGATDVQASDRCPLPHKSQSNWNVRNFMTISLLFSEKQKMAESVTKTEEYPLPAIWNVFSWGVATGEPLMVLRRFVRCCWDGMWLIPSAFHRMQNPQATREFFNYSENMNTEVTVRFVKGKGENHTFWCKLRTHKGFSWYKTR